MKLILTIFKWGAAILCCFLIFITLVLAVRYGFTLYENDPHSYISINNDNMRHEFKNTAKTEAERFIYSPDKITRYKQAKPTYTVDIKPHSGIGYYHMVSTLFFVALGALILRKFWQIFGQISLDAPFNARVVHLLYTAAYLYIISEVLGWIHYYVLGKLINNSMQIDGLHPVDEMGTALLTGLLMLIIAVVYKRGLEIYEENSLTV
ncbi:DUF2975 domain-containing protein [Daejeonella sp.]|uniref:DUF2975 domain-containing protein n=1 Tax=Daejeonella sp. TaxID=2805397 RepID=UPI0030C3A394